MEKKIYNQNAEEVGKIELTKSIFDLPWNDDLVHQVVTSIQANKRVVIAYARGRGEVSGGGRKPWRQKGTGMARHGSIRSPLWKGGGVTHGPTREKVYHQKINKKMKKKAFFTVLSKKLRDNEILFLDKINLIKPKTKEADNIIKKISQINNFEKLTSKKKNKMILALPKKDEKVSRGFRNIPGLRISEARNLNVLDILTYKYLVFVNFDEKNFTS